MKPSENHPFKKRGRRATAEKIDESPKHPRPDWMSNSALLPKKPPTGPTAPKDYR